MMIEGQKNTTDVTDIAGIMMENERRRIAWEQEVYNPMTGEGCYGNRAAVCVAGSLYFVPVSLKSRISGQMTETEFARLRIEEDFEYWCARCVTIKDKVSAREVPFILNRPQRRVLAVLEGMRTAGKPIRMIMLKARQWGGSTLVQIYMAWMQMVHHENWNSLICGHLKDTSAAIKGTYSRLLKNYPRELADDPERLPSFKTFGGSRNVSEITGRGNLVISGSSESQEAVRGYDISMAHLSEVSFWRNTDQKSPENLIRAVCGSIALDADTVVVLESTANGVGNYFHREWIRAKTGQSDKTAVFVPWHEIEIYRKPVRDPVALWDSLDDYEKSLWERGCTLEMIAWYHVKRKEYSTHAQMKAEYPTDDIEAFVNSGEGVFGEQAIEQLRADCHQPRWIGEVEGDARDGRAALDNLRFAEMPNGRLQVWRMPETGSQRRNRYVVTVDVGGVSEKSDFSVIAVIDRFSDRRKPEVVAQWRGHTFHDLLAWKAAQIARWYGNALLVIESNTLESEYTEGDGSGFILDIVSRVYKNLYSRSASPTDGYRGERLGFHTNVSTKEKIIYRLMGVLRDGAYVEHDVMALDEYNFYERKPNGGFGARRGNHDDILMSRAIGFDICDELGRLDARIKNCCEVLNRQGLNYDESRCV